MKLTKYIKLFSLFLCFFFVYESPAQSIDYNKEKEFFTITGFSKENPATLETLLDFDQKNSLNKITYDETSKTFTVNASLWVGDDKAIASYFQIGDQEFPEPTVIMNGSIWVKPMAKSIKRTDGLPSVLNYLKIGNENDENIKVVLMFTPGSAFIIGDRKPGKPRVIGGCVDIFNTKITCTTQGKYWRTYIGTGGPTSGPAWYATAVNLQNSEFSNFNGPFYGINTEASHSTIKNCVFKNAGSVLGGGYHHVEDCIFENLNCAISGSIAKAVNCVFKSNDYNWKIYIDSFTFLNCDIEPQKKPVYVVRRSSNNKKLMMRLHQQNKVYPSAIIEKSFQVKVLDANGKPIEDAGVSITCEEKPEAVVGGIAMTNKDGITPAEIIDALIITTEEYKASNNPEKPLKRFYKYKIKVIERKRQKAVEYDSHNPLPKVLTIIMD